MAYNASIPQPGDRPSDSQSQLLANFQAIGADFAVNHVGFNITGEGKHKFLQMPEQPSAPSTLADEGAVYTKDISSATQLFYRRESDGAEYQITGAFTDAAQGVITIPGGIKIAWGTSTTVGGISNISLAAAPYSFTTLYNVQVTPNTLTPGVVMSAATAATTAQVRSTFDVSFFFVAIGK